jgi:hypothetical protein
MEIAKGTFRRVSPVEFFERGGVPLGWIVVRHSHVDTIRHRRQTHGRWVCLRSERGQIFRVLRYSVNLPASEIVVDWAGWIDLQGRGDKESEELSLTITTAQWWQFATIPFRHVDPAYRLSTWLGAISVALGILSVLLVRPWELVDWPRAFDWIVTRYWSKNDRIFRDRLGCFSFRSALTFGRLRQSSLPPARPRSDDEKPCEPIGPGRNAFS